MMGIAGSRKVTKPTQPKAPEDSHAKGSKIKTKQVTFEDEDTDESEDEDPAPARTGPPTSKKVRELPYVDVPPLRQVVRADKPRPAEKDGPAYTTRAPIEKEELGQEVLEEVLNASLDVTVRQLLGTAPSIRKELIKQIAKVRRAPDDVPTRSQYKATVEDASDDDEPIRPIKPKTPSKAEIERINIKVKEKISKGLNEPKNSSYHDRTEELARIKNILKEELEESDGEIPGLAKSGRKEIDVATLPSASSTTVYTKDGRTVITMGDPVLQYLNSLPKGETSSKTFYMKESSLALRSIYPLVNNARQEEALLDSGSQIVSMSKESAIALKMSWNPDISINMQSAQGHVEPTLGLAIGVPFTFGELTVLLQVHIINKPSYKILLGWPFDALTRSNIQNERDGSQMITITDPASDLRVVLPTYPRSQGPACTTQENSESFQ